MRDAKHVACNGRDEKCIHTVCSEKPEGKEITWETSAHNIQTDLQETVWACELHLSGWW